MNKNAQSSLRFGSGVVKLLEQSGVNHVILSPGSRSAPLALSFMRNKAIKSYVINDERSAAYMALGMAKHMQQSVALVCTSGTAALNYAPALAEANNQNVSLIVLTADRPSEFIGIGENQSIFQKSMYAGNIRYSFHIDFIRSKYDQDNEHCRILNQAINKSRFPVPCPVHINISLPEPLLEGSIELHKSDIYKKMDFDREGGEVSVLTLKTLIDELVGFKRIMIVAGMNYRQPRLRNVLNKLLNMTDIVFAGDITSNLNDLERGVDHPSVVFRQMTEREKKDLKPDLLITFGSYMISKEMRTFFRETEEIEHWHIDEYGDFKDTFFKLKRGINTSPLVFFRAMLKNIASFKNKKFMSYYNSWQKAEEKAENYLREKIENDAEYDAVLSILKKLPSNSVLHCGNSLPVRIVNDLGLKSIRNSRNIEVVSNRGTSGIDGCLSTAVGTSIIDERIHTVILGDHSFLYDSNALWNKYLRGNLKIIVLNNKGGGIFRRMKDIAAQPEINDYFVNYVPVSISKIADAYGIADYSCSDLSKLPMFLNKIYRFDSHAAILEIVL